MKRHIEYIYLFLAVLFLSGCSSFMTDTAFYEPITADLAKGKFDEAAKYITDASNEGHYSDKDRVLGYLDRGIIFHYQGEYEKSNRELENAESAIEDLFTKSISKGAASLLLNDNALAYDGEVYEDIYINIFKALNYIALNQTDEAYVEVKKVNVKLQALDNKYEALVSELNSSEDAKIEIEQENIGYYNNVLANYLSYLIFRAEGEYDDSRISLEQAKEAFRQYPEIYDFPMPPALDNTENVRSAKLNVLAFAGQGPKKEAIGARISTISDFIIISDPTNYHVQPIYFPGITGGYNFKFSFPTIVEPGTYVDRIEVYIDGQPAGDAHLIENIAKVAEQTFETEKGIVYFKTATRAVVKGIASGALGKKLSDEAGGGLLGGLAQLATNVAFDASENADLRNWRTIPAYSFVAEFDLEPGFHDVEVRYYDDTGKMLYKKKIDKLSVNKGLNLIEAFYIN